MQSSGQSRELIPSLVGVGLLADILPDLPLPSHTPSELERTVLGQKDVSLDNMKLLNNTDPHMCALISTALSSVDNKYLKLKCSSSRGDFTSSSSPALIKAVFSGHATPKLRLKKIDTSTHILSESQLPKEVRHKMSPRSAVPVSPATSTPQGSSLYTPHRLKSTEGTPSHHIHDSITPSSGVRKRKRSSSSPGRSLKKKHKQSQSLVISIERRKLQPTQTFTTKKRRRLVSSSSSSGEEGSQCRTNLIVSIPRHLLRHSNQPKVPYHSPRISSPSSMPLPPPWIPAPPMASHTPPPPPYYHPLHQAPPPPLHLPQGYPHPAYTYHSVAPEQQFALAPNASLDPLVDSDRAIKKKHKVKKHRHHLKQENPYANQISRYRRIVLELLDHGDRGGSDALLSRGTLSQLVDETVRLKQLAILHHIPVECFTQLLSLMDRHILDSAELLMNVSPEEAGDSDIHVWREMAREKILRSLDASLVILHITTAPRMPTAVQVEESIDQVVNHASYHLEHNVYPEFDPVYRGQMKESGVLPRQKRRYAGHSSSYKTTLPVYHRLTEVVNNLALLLETNPLTDTIVLKLSSLGTMPFFVENVSSLQLSALKLVRAIFSRYEKHRDLILEDIFASLARLPTTKRNLRSFRLSNGDSIQMLTALILQFVQCMLVVPKHITSQGETGSTDGDNQHQDADLLMIQSYDLALRTGKTFLGTFMKKCCGGRDEDDFRPLFDNFIQDLLATLGQPEWPASESLLTLLGMLLVRTFSNKSTEQHLKVTALEHLGVIAARLRKDAISSTQDEHHQLIEILAEVLQKKLDSHSPLPSPTATRMDAFSENSRHLQKALIAYLTKYSSNDPSSAYARDFYIGQWLRDNHVELEKMLQGQKSSLLTDPLLGDDGPDDPSLNWSVHQAEENKNFLVSLLKPMPLSVVDQLASVLDEKKAVLVTRYLSSSRALSRSFDHYLQQLLRVLNEPAVHVRTRAMKALSTIVAADPTILSRPEVRRAVHSRFLDHSTLVREASVDLVGRFILLQPDLTAQYYEMLLERILDTGISVRKRVIKILKDVCVMQPDFSKVNEICLKMIRRIDDEEGIKQLVTSVFAQMWFTMPPVESRRETIMKRVTTITDMIAASNENEWFEELLKQLLKGEDKNTILKVCQLMVDSIKERIITLDESSDTKSSKQTVSCFATLDLFCKIKPSFLLPHATTLHPYLASKCSNADEMQVLYYVARILEATIPLMHHPSSEFLTSVEEDLVKLTLKHGQNAVQSCISCLGVVVNQVTHSYSLVKEYFQKFYVLLRKVQFLHTKDPNDPQLDTLKYTVIRSVFTVGLFCKHFDMNTIMEAKGQDISKQVYSLLVYFANSKDMEIKTKSMLGLGLLCIRYPEMMLDTEAKELYLTSLSSSAPLSMKFQVMKNLFTHLQEVDSTLQQASADRGQSVEEKESLLELGDRHSSVTSRIAQIFLVHVADAYYTTEPQIRMLALKVISLVLKQGLVHPGQCVPYLISISSDPEEPIKVKADQLLTEHNSRFGNFLQTQIITGLKKAHQLQALLASDSARGCADAAGGQVSLLARLYTLVRSSKPQRRAFLRVFLRHFEDYEKNSLSMLLFLADNLAHFPYTVLEEPLFILHHIDMTISVTGSNLLQGFRDALGSSGTAPVDDEEDNIERLSQQSCDLRQLNFCCRSCQGCVLLLVLKQHLKKCYGLTDKKCQKYSPNENVKAFDKAIVKKQWQKFEPVTVLQEVRKEMLGQRASLNKEECLQQYLEFKKLMNLLDPFEGEDDDSDQENAPPCPPQPPPVEPAVAPQPPQQQPVVEDVVKLAPITPQSKRRSRSRASSTSSNTSTSSHTKKGKGTDSGRPSKSRRARQIIDDSDSDTNDPLFTT